MTFVIVTTATGAILSIENEAPDEALCDLTGKTVIETTVPAGYPGSYAWNPSTLAFEQDLSFARNSKWQQVKAARESAQTDTLTITGKGIYQGDQESQFLLAQAAFRAAQSFGTWPINWTMADNSQVSHGAADILAAWDAFCARAMTIHGISQTVRNEINTATISGLAAIDPDTVFDPPPTGGGEMVD